MSACSARNECYNVTMNPVSIIIPCLNEEHYIGKLLDSLVVQTFRNFEVIVVDGKSEDKTKDVVLRFSKTLPHLSFVESSKRQVSFQRNLGAKHARYERLLFLDADIQVKPDFLQKNFG